ncbi:MAG: glycosyltransferase family 4 protein [Exilibacterium sp.]
MLSFILTVGFRHYALVRHLLDVPNNRSSQSEPTPRGGGVAVVIAFVGSASVFGSLWDHWSVSLVTVLGAGAGIALLGFLDDHNHIDFHWRLLMHFLFACCVVVGMGGLPGIDILGYTPDFWLGWVAAVFYVVWLVNLYNFMDGIDGIAAIEAITVCVGAALCAMAAGAGVQNWVLPGFLAAAALGFLLLNFPPAKIFMGDAGSGFIGLVLGGLSLQAAWDQPQLFWSWLILLGVFFVDATVTLVRRVLRGEKFYQAHRSHAYQSASRQLKGGHRVLIWLALYFNAGQAERERQLPT